MTPVSSTKRGPYAPSKKRREAVVAAVLELVDEVGHEGVTTALVSERSGVPETTVLYHFPSKDHLLVAALARSEDLRAEAVGAYGPDAFLDAEALGKLAPETFDDRRSRLYLMLKGQAATPDHPAAEYFVARASRQIEIFSQLLTHSQQNGLAQPGLDAVNTARQIIAVWDGLTQMWVSDPSFEIGPLLKDAIRRLTGQDLMEVQALLSRP
ncbi:TetR/AcrR family transcriptional regulator [Mycetocola zhadangensis]|uniref:TetR/AcrR family transcriptional regulator n=1 Tax=Mycetocola zhadangensis TaxID=1164595 RepID=UPI003A4E32C9